MRKNYESRLSVEPITDDEIASAIRYLDPDHQSVEVRGGHPDAVLAICVSLIVLLAGALAYIWLYMRTS